MKKMKDSSRETNGVMIVAAGRGNLWRIIYMAFFVLLLVKYVVSYHELGWLKWYQLDNDLAYEDREFLTIKSTGEEPLPIQVCSTVTGKSGQYCMQSIVTAETAVQMRKLDYDVEFPFFGNSKFFKPFIIDRDILQDPRMVQGVSTGSAILPHAKSHRVAYMATAEAYWEHNIPYGLAVLGGTLCETSMIAVLIALVIAASIAITLLVVTTTATLRVSKVRA